MSKNQSLSLFTMLPPFYDRPLYKDVNTYLKLIEKEFPIKIKKYSYKKYAFGNDVFIINERYVFRFPRTKQAINHLKYEIDFLNFLKNRVRINIPNYTYVSKNGDFAGYNIITGKILTPPSFKSLSTKDKKAVVNQLIEFVNDFHRIRLNDFTKYRPGKREDFIPIEKKIKDDLENKLFPKLSKKEVEVIKNFYKESKKYLQNIPSSCAIHGDLYAYNVIWNESKGLLLRNKNKSEVGVIDFSDYLIGDPARDFEVFYDFGPEYAEKAYEKYEGSKDNEFLQRAQIYYKVHGIYTLLSSLLGAQISFEFAYSHFFKEKFNL